MSLLSRFTKEALCAFLVVCFGAGLLTAQTQHATLPLGEKAPKFKLKGVDGKNYTLSSFKKAKILTVVFTCNHCPTAQAYEDRLVRYANDYRAKGVQVVAISPSSPDALRLDECSYTDLGDTYEEMKIRSADKHFPFPYLYDGDLQKVASAYGPVATPHVFIFDEKRILRYCGRFDDTEKPSVKPRHNDAIDATEALLAGEPVKQPETKTFGCSVKWKEKNSGVQASIDEWAKEPVQLHTIDSAGVAKLLRNDSDKLRIINVWATWCGPCVREMPDLININRMYRVRNTELITISTDNPAMQEQVLRLLKSKQASSSNYILDKLDIYAFIDLVDPAWKGALPYTLVLEPGGKVIYRNPGPIDPLKLKKIIVEHPLMGRTYK